MTAGPKIHRRARDRCVSKFSDNTKALNNSYADEVVG